MCSRTLTQTTVLKRCSSSSSRLHSSRWQIRRLIFVPAVQAAYGPLDAALGHHRRYSKPTLRRAFETAGLDLVALRYTNPIGLLGWMYNAHVTGTTEHTSGQVRLFEQLVAPWALPLDRLVAPPVGLSLFAVGRARVHTA